MQNNQLQSIGRIDKNLPNHKSFFTQILPDVKVFEMEIVSLIKENDYTLFGGTNADTALDIISSTNDTTYLFHDLTLELVYGWIQSKIEDIYNLSENESKKMMTNLGFDGNATLLAYDVVGSIFYSENKDLHLAIAQAYIKANKFDVNDLKELARSVIALN